MQYSCKVRADWLYDVKTHKMPCPMLLNNHYCYSFNNVIILFYNIFPGCKNNDINVRKRFFLLPISIFIIIYKHLKLLLICVGIRYVHFIAFYDQNNYKTKKQPQNL